ncbi:basic proline-rich protein-like [Bubalus kerabau]|uniref:basic proline-rich protein-like n=1 Tax=Bubalus carabanensis TaxID=3119969 RepID=UPI001D0F682C|nr:basic proline-rich protein-like [Bubalus carabanensis]
MGGRTEPAVLGGPSLSIASHPIPRRSPPLPLGARVPAANGAGERRAVSRLGSAAASGSGVARRAAAHGSSSPEALRPRPRRRLPPTLLPSASPAADGAASSAAPRAAGPAAASAAQRPAPGSPRRPPVGSAVPARCDAGRRARELPPRGDHPAPGPAAEDSRRPPRTSFRAPKEISRRLPVEPLRPLECPPGGQCLRNGPGPLPSPSLTRGFPALGGRATVAAPPRGGVFTSSATWEAWNDVDLGSNPESAIHQLCDLTSALTKHLISGLKNCFFPLSKMLLFSVSLRHEYPWLKTPYRGSEIADALVT